MGGSHVVSVVVAVCAQFAPSGATATATATGSGSGAPDKAVLQECKNFIPKLSTEEHKGDRGRIGVLGGSEEYTGSPYYSAMAAIRTGADMVYVFCASPAAVPIKSYGPEFMVLPCLDSANALEKIKPWLARLHGILIGPGLGRNETVTRNIVDLIEFLKRDDDGAIPMVLDADAFYILNAYPDLIAGYPNQVYLTPNSVEFNQLATSVLGEARADAAPRDRLCALAERLGPKVTLLVKGASDRIAHGDLVVAGPACGAPRRCNGQGDVLAGALVTLAVWLDRAEFWQPAIGLSHEQLVGYAASALVKSACQRAYAACGRSLTASDILRHVHPAFRVLFEDK